MIGVIQPDRDYFRRGHRGERFYPFQWRCFSLKGRRAENIALQAEQLAINHFGVKNLLTLLKPANGSHKICRALYQSALIPCKPKRNTVGGLALYFAPIRL